MNLLALAIAPGLAIILFIYAKDRYNKEPLQNLIITFLLGALSIFPAVLAELLLEKRVSGMYRGITATAVNAFFVVAFSEEFSKFLVVRFYAFRRKAFDDPFDGIVYSVMAGMGFATVENILYVSNYGVGTAIMRMFLSVPAHATFAILMGYHIGLAKFSAGQRMWQFILGLFWAILFHGTFDFFLFLGNSWLHLLGALGSFIVAIRLSMKAIRIQQGNSRIQNTGVNSQ